LTLSVAASKLAAEDILVRVVGYVRESADREDTRPAFVQHEDIRRWTAEHGYELVAVCRDARPQEGSPGRAGYLALLGVLGTGGIDAVVLPGIAVLSDDQIVQEILLWDLRSRGVRVVSTDAGDADTLGPEQTNPTRMLIRDVLSRVAEHAGLLGRRGFEAPSGPADVVIELLGDGELLDDDDADPIEVGDEGPVSSS
jgi:hypothetical protein